MQQQRTETFYPLYLNDPIYGSAWYSNKCIIEAGDERFFTRVRYQFPGESKYRYQAFYQSSGHNTSQKGVWFPFDGITLQDDPSKSKKFRLYKNWIAKPLFAKSVQHQKNHNWRKGLRPHYLSLSQKKWNTYIPFRDRRLSGQTLQNTKS